MDPIAYQDLVSGRSRGISATVVRLGLHALSAGYGIGVHIRNRRYDRDSSRAHPAGIPVISIGNLTAGGTGKTPMVAWMCRWLVQQELRPVILSRGFGAEANQPNDEAMQLASLLPDVPHIQNPDRVAGAASAVSDHDAQVIVLDDGFQHRRLARDLDIVLIDATNPFGHGFLLPRGLLREPIVNLRRADLVVITRADQVDSGTIEKLRARIASLSPDMPVVVSTHRADHFRSAQGIIETAEQWVHSGTRVAAFCAIGNPSSFERTLRDLGLTVVGMKVFPDHHRFTDEDIRLLEDWVRQLDAPVRCVCTHKDLVKLTTDQIAEADISALCVELDIVQGADSIESCLASVLDAGPRSSSTHPPHRLAAPNERGRARSERPQKS